jgi:transketolase C-terminal domain/subunit
MESTVSHTEETEDTSPISRSEGAVSNEATLMAEAPVLMAGVGSLLAEALDDAGEAPCKSVGSGDTFGMKLLKAELGYGDTMVFVQEAEADTA